MDNECASAPIEAICDMHSASEPRCGRTDDRQPESGPLRLLVLTTIKPLEHPIPIRCRYPYAVIRDAQGPAIAEWSQNYNNVATVASIPDGIVD